MKVKIEFTLDIDEVAWAIEYGFAVTDPISEIRADVKSYVESEVRMDLADKGVLR